MTKRRWLLPLIAVLLILLGAALLPSLLRAMPSRYVARLPEPIQAWGARPQVAELPTAVVGRSADYLLAEIESPAELPRATYSAPATPTPRPTTGAPGTPTAAGARKTATATATLPSPTPTATPTEPIPTSARLGRIVHQFQDWNNCGPATLTMALSYFQVFHNQSQVADFLKPNEGTATSRRPRWSPT